MNTELPLEEILRRAPQPSAPARLAADLLADIRLPVRAPQPAPRPLWLRLWLPATGLAGAAAVLILVLVFSGAGSSRLVAQSLEALAKVKSFHVTERIRSGPGKPVIKDNSLGPQIWPNYTTSIHPDNPLVESQHWFRYDPANPTQGRTRTESDRREKWQAGNIVLEVDRQTGAREVRLDSSATMFAGIAAPLVGSANGSFTEIDPRKLPDFPAELAATVSVNETRVKMGDEVEFFRVWVDRQSGLPLRFQRWGTEWPEIAPEVLLQEFVFSDFDTDFPDATFAFAPTEADLAPLGLTTTQLAQLPNNAFSVRVIGTAGQDVSGTLTDGSGVREVRGRLPFSFVHAPVGDVKLAFRMVDGQKHNFGAVINGNSMETVTARISGEVYVTKGGGVSLAGR